MSGKVVKTNVSLMLSDLVKLSSRDTNSIEKSGSCQTDNLSMIIGNAEVNTSVQSEEVSLDGNLDGNVNIVFTDSNRFTAFKYGLLKIGSLNASVNLLDYSGEVLSKFKPGIISSTSGGNVKFQKNNCKGINFINLPEIISSDSTTVLYLSSLTIIDNFSLPENIFIYLNNLFTIDGISESIISGKLIIVFDKSALKFLDFYGNWFCGKIGCRENSDMCMWLEEKFTESIEFWKKCIICDHPDWLIEYAFGKKISISDSDSVEINMELCGGKYFSYIIRDSEHTGVSDGKKDSVSIIERSNNIIKIICKKNRPFTFVIFVDESESFFEYFLSKGLFEFVSCEENSFGCGPPNILGEFNGCKQSVVYPVWLCFGDDNPCRFSGELPRKYMHNYTIKDTETEKLTDDFVKNYNDLINLFKFLTIVSKKLSNFKTDSNKHEDLILLFPDFGKFLIGDDIDGLIRDHYTESQKENDGDMLYVTLIEIIVPLYNVIKNSLRVILFSGDFLIKPKVIKKSSRISSESNGISEEKDVFSDRPVIGYNQPGLLVNNSGIESPSNFRQSSMVYSKSSDNWGGGMKNSLSNIGYEAKYPGKDKRIYFGGIDVMV